MEKKKHGPEEAEKIDIKEKPGNEKMPVVSLKDILQCAETDRETADKTKQYTKKGGYHRALADFESLQPVRVFELDIGKVGILSDGSRAIVRTTNKKDGKPTLEIQRANDKNPIEPSVSTQIDQITSYPEEWAPWEPIPGLSSQYYIDKVYTDETGFAVILSEEHNKSKTIQILFKNWVSAFRYTDETLRAGLVANLHKRYGIAFLSQSTFFTVTNSSYLQWLSEQSSTISDYMKLMHFVIFDPNISIDIAASYEPEVTIKS